MSAALPFDPKGQRIPVQGATLGMGWLVCIRDRDGGYASRTRTVGRGGSAPLSRGRRIASASRRTLATTTSAFASPGPHRGAERPAGTCSPPRCSRRSSWGQSAEPVFAAPHRGQSFDSPVARSCRRGSGGRGGRACSRGSRRHSSGRGAGSRYSKKYYQTTLGSFRSFLFPLGFLGAVGFDLFAVAIQL